MKVDLLRLRLPPWPGGNAAAVALRCGYREPGGRWRDAGILTPDAVAQGFRAKRIEVCLHPGDVPMAVFPMPPLSGRRLRTAIPGAIEPCALQPLDQLVTGFGPRAADGTVPVAWIARRVMQGWLGLLRQHGLAVRELHLPAAFLPCPAEGWVACRIDEWVIVRTGRDQGFARWLPEGADRMAGLAAHADGDEPLPAVQWAGDAEAAECWSGEGWSWALQVADAAEGRATSAWVVPAVGWGTLAVAVWLTGLNLYASQLAREGQALKRQMAARVKAAFPDVPVVVNPVQQARQQKEALAAGGQPAATGDLAGLLRASSNLLAQTPAGQVQGFRYTAGTLHIRWRDGGAPGVEERRALQAQGIEQGLGVKAGADGLRVTLASPAAPSEKNNDRKEAE